MRSNSAHTSAMRPEITMRPAQSDRGPFSVTRKTRSAGGMMVVFLAMIEDAMVWQVGRRTVQTGWTRPAGRGRAAGAARLNDVRP